MHSNYRLTSLVSAVQNHPCTPIPKPLQSPDKAIPKWIPNFAAIVKVRVEPAQYMQTLMFRDLQNPLIFWLRRLSTRCSLVISSMCFPHVRDSTICTPRILLLGARPTGSFSMKMCGSSGRALILALKPITKYSVLAMWGSAYLLPAIF